MKWTSSLVLVLVLTGIASGQPQVTVLANSIDLQLSQSYLDTLSSLGIGVEIINARKLPQHQGDGWILILGGPNAPEGVGAVVNGLLTQRERQDILGSPGSKVTVVVTNPWADRQKVMVFAGYGKEQTRKLFGEAQGDLMKSLRFNDSSYLENNTGNIVGVPPLDETQPFTEVDADQANSIIKTVPGVKLLDVRGKPFYDAGHIPGAVSMPERDIEANVASLPKDATYLIYCGGNSESIRASNFLSANGFKRIYRLVDGYMAWRKAGYPREQTPKAPGISQ